jgi:hypothetical protein
VQQRTAASYGQPAAVWIGEAVVRVDGLLVRAGDQVVLLRLLALLLPDRHIQATTGRVSSTLSP